jgi:hypothetical protein
MASDANVIVMIPTPWLHEGSWLEKLYDELLYSGILADVEATTGVSVGKDLIYNIISWRCTEYGENRCPAVIATLDGRVILLKISPYAEKGYIEQYDFKEILVEELRGLLRHSECDLAGYIC